MIFLMAAVFTQTFVNFSLLYSVIENRKKIEKLNKGEGE